MQINPINKQSFKGSLVINGLSAKQKQAFNSIYPELEKQVKPIKNLILYIDGSLDNAIISRATGKEPKYLLLNTQLKTATIPVIQDYTESTDPKEILEIAKSVISDHIKSKRYTDFLGFQFKLKPESIKHIEKATGLTYKELTTLSFEECDKLMIERGTKKKPNPIKKWFADKYKQIGEKFGLLEKQYDIYTHID